MSKTSSNGVLETPYVIICNSVVMKNGLMSETTVSSRYLSVIRNTLSWFGNITNDVKIYSQTNLSIAIFLHKRFHVFFSFFFVNVDVGCEYDQIFAKLIPAKFYFSILEWNVSFRYKLLDFFAYRWFYFFVLFIYFITFNTRTSQGLYKDE